MTTYEYLHKTHWYLKPPVAAVLKIDKAVLASAYKRQLLVANVAVGQLTPSHGAINVVALNLRVTIGKPL